MWSIERLRLELPAGYEHRADRIAQLLARELEAVAAPGDVRLDELRLPPIEIDPAAGDSEIAWRIARGMVQSLAGAGRAGREIPQKPK
jgi:hypothetical protein